MNYNEAKLEYLLMFKHLKDIDEQLIATSARYSYSYATNILKGRFILGETAIARESFYRAYYSMFLNRKGIHYELQ